MSDRSEPIRQTILDIAGEEFLMNGYQKASMRTIAAKVGVTATALYRHFANKKALFSALVEPVWQEFMRNLAAHDAETFRTVMKESPERLWELSEQEFGEALTYAYDHFEVFKLLLCCSAGSGYDRFQHELVEHEAGILMLMVELMREQGYQVNQIDAGTLYLLLSGFFSSLFEMIIHDYSRSEAEQHVKVLAVYFYSGMRAVLGI